MTKHPALQIYEEWAAPYTPAKSAIDLVGSYCNDKQKEFIRHDGLFKAWIATRRSSKSTAAVVGAIQICLDKPRSNILYVGLTLDAVLRTVYYEIFESIFLTNKIPAELKYKNQIVFANGSRIYCLGSDATKKERDKFRGFKGALVVIDECQSHEHDLRILINEILGPTLADTKSPVWLLGTCGPKMGTNLWYEITAKELHPEWMIFKSSWRDNTSIERNTGQPVCKNVAEHLAALRAAHPGIELTPSYRQEWEGEWVLESTAHIYKYRSMPIDVPSDEYLATAKYCLGVDLGYADPTALVTICYNTKHNNKLYVVDAFCKSEMLVPDIVAKIKELDQKYHYVHMVGDSSSLQVFETLRINYNIPLVKAQKAGKLGHQMVINSDFLTNTIQILPTPGNQELINQLQTVIWKESDLANGEHVEDPGFKNDLCVAEGSLVSTEFGDIPIEDLKPGMKVWTRIGLRRVLRSWCTGEKEVVSLNGLLLTPDHPVWNQGWTRVSSLTPDCTVLSWHTNKKLLNLKTSYIEGTQITQKEQGAFISPEFIKTALDGIRNDFMLQSGFQSMVQSQRDCTFTTRIMTQRTIRSMEAISNYSRLRSMFASTGLRKERSWQEVSLSKYSPWPANIGSPKRDANSIEYYQTNIGKNPIHINSNVKYVNEYSNPLSQLQNAVRWLVFKNDVDLAARTMRSEAVLNAARSSSVTDLDAPAVVRNRVALGGRQGRAKVYDLEVDEAHEFFANGILVSNCDALLYSHAFSRHQWYDPPKPKKGMPTPAEIQAGLVKQLIKAQKDEAMNIDFALPNG